MRSRLYTLRFEFFLATQVLVLFGSLVIPSEAFEIVSPIFFYLNIIAGSFLLPTNEKLKYSFTILILVIIGGVFTAATFAKSNIEIFNYLRIVVLFLFYSIVTYTIIKQTWKATLVSKNIIFGVITGFISLGFIGFFICVSIEVIHPNSFSGLLQFDGTNSVTERLMYFSYITLMTIGYGDILPQTHLAQKATILIGLMGQFYLVIITAIIVGKFINQSSSTNNPIE